MLTIRAFRPGISAGFVAIVTSALKSLVPPVIPSTLPAVFRVTLTNLFTMKQLALFSLLLLGSACAKENARPATPKTQSSSDVIIDDTACLDVYDPVCSNGVTYPNGCYARKAGVKTYTRGACGQSPDI